jgi:hypothetical protein
MEQSSPWEAVVAQLAKFSNYYGTENSHYSIHSNPPLDPTLS